MERVNADSGAELGLAAWLLDELSMPATNSDRILVAECIRLLARQGGTVKNAADYILQAARGAELEGTTLNRFWFSDRKYLPATRNVSASWTPEKVEARQAQERAAERERRAAWESMSEAYRKANPWGVQ